MIQVNILQRAILTVIQNNEDRSYSDESLSGSDEERYEKKID